MVNLSPEAARHVPAEYVNLYSIRDRRVAQLREAEGVVEHKLLSPVWRHESTALVDYLSQQVAADEAKIAAFEERLPDLEAKARAELVARATVGNAMRAHGFGEIEPKRALKLRDDLEVAESTLRVCARELKDAVASVRAVGLPSTANLPPPSDAARIVDSLATFVTNRRFRPEMSGSAVDRDTWLRWLELGDDDLMYLPLAASKVLDAAHEERSRRLGTRPDGSWFERDSKRESIILPEKEFIAELAKFKAAREVHLRSKVGRATDRTQGVTPGPRARRGGARSEGDRGAARDRSLAFRFRQSLTGGARSDCSPSRACPPVSRWALRPTPSGVPLATAPRENVRPVR